MPDFKFELPGMVVSGKCEAGATDKQIVSVFAADFAEGECEPGIEYHVDSFVRLSYTITPLEAVPVKAAHKAATKRKAK